MSSNNDLGSELVWRAVRVWFASGVSSYNA
jgi:hypothetical protein